MGMFIGLSFNNAPYVVVQWVNSWRAGRPHITGYVVIHIVRHAVMAICALKQYMSCHRICYQSKIPQTLLEPLYMQQHLPEVFEKRHDVSITADFSQNHDS